MSGLVVELTLGAWSVIGALVLALGFGVYRRATDGRARAARGVRRGGASQWAELAPELGERATLVQFSSPICAPCRATRRLLGDLAAERVGVEHLDIDVSERLDLADRFGIRRTPTVLILDADGRCASGSWGPRREWRPGPASMRCWCRTPVTLWGDCSQQRPPLRFSQLDQFR